MFASLKNCIDSPSMALHCHRLVVPISKLSHNFCFCVYIFLYNILGSIKEAEVTFLREGNSPYTGTRRLFVYRGGHSIHHSQADANFQYFIISTVFDIWDFILTSFVSTLWELFFGRLDEFHGCYIGKHECHVIF